ncbi:MAG: GNAT family N-acetyltransferase [Rikenellaceae bacterium]|nr:GNAT family N-acetyltransferase [Rikenellaceae bacterium]
MKLKSRNISDYQGQGYGKTLVEFISHCKDECEIIVDTGEVPDDFTTPTELKISLLKLR